jgi:hypothetical protein
MRAILVLLFISGGFAVAQPKPTPVNAAPESYPVWWASDGNLRLAKIEDAETLLAEPFSNEDLDSLRHPPDDYSGPPQPLAHNCKELLAVVTPNNFSSPNRVGAWGWIGARCAELRELAHAVPARHSAVQSPIWTPAVVSLLPARIFAAGDEESHRAAIEADLKGLSLSQYWTGMTDAQGRQRGKARKGIPIHHAFGFGDESFELGAELKDDTNAGVYLIDFDYYNVVARGDFIGDGWEDLLVETMWHAYRNAWTNVAVYVLTRKTVAGRIEIVKQVF